VKLRIAVSGSAGTGKTTVGRALAQRLEIPFIEEGMRKRIEGGLKLHGLSNAGRRDLLAELWDEQSELEQRAGTSFVADRSAFDYIAFWLHYSLYDDVAESDDWIARLRAAGESYDRVLLMPEGRTPDALAKKSSWLPELCLKHGFRFTTRLHIILWGDERGR